MPHGFGQTICPPCYHEYIQREIYQQDYLDLFGASTTETFPRSNFKGKCYVKITTDPILGALVIPAHPIYVLHTAGNDYLLVDYDFPYPGQLNQGRAIEYIMIGEAAPLINPPLVGYGIIDDQNSFFYNILHTKSTGYFTAPLAAFGINGNNKINKLVSLADRGALLLDIFPFAIEYDKIRDSLIISGALNSFWSDSTNPYSLLFRMIPIKPVGQRACLLAPPKISFNIAKQINSSTPLNTLGLTFKAGINTFSIPSNLITPSSGGGFYNSKIPFPNGINGLTGPYLLPPNSKNLSVCIQVPIYSCCSYSGAGTVPHAIFIKSALDL